MTNVTMRTRLYSLFIALLVLLAACGDGGPTDPGDDKPLGKLVLDLSTLTLTNLDEASPSITGKVDGTTELRITLTLISESRWLHDQPVLDLSEMASGRIVRAKSPGTAILLAEAPRATSDTLVVHVAPEVPLMLQIQPLSEVNGLPRYALRGYRMHEVGNISVDGNPATTLNADSAQAEITLPLAPATEDCAGTTYAQEISFDQGTVFPGVMLPRRQEGGLALAIGEAYRLPAGSSCLRLAPAPGAKYALALYDATYLRRAETGSEGRDWLQAPNQRATVTDKTMTASANTISWTRTPSRDLLRADDRVLLNEGYTGEHQPRWRETPWKVGEVYWVEGSSAREGFARVLRIDGQIVTSLFLPDSALFTPSYAARLDSLMDYVSESVVPLLHVAFGARHPITSTGSGQLHILLDQLTGAQGLTMSQNTGADFGTQIIVALRQWDTPGMLHIVAHELAHAWQHHYLVDTRPLGTTPVPFTTRWASEGGAEAFAMEALRHYFNIPMSSNWDWNSSPVSQWIYGIEAELSKGELLDGYHHSSSLLRDLIVRRILAGDEYDSALAAVLRGALEGWYGFDESYLDNGPWLRAGLTSRMQAIIPAWDPVEAVLTWTLSQAVDEELDSEVFTNPLYRTRPTSDSGWPRMGTLRAGSGNSLGIEWRVGGARFLTLENGDVGSAAQIEAPPETEWMIVRYH